MGSNEVNSMCIFTKPFAANDMASYAKVSVLEQRSSSTYECQRWSVAESCHAKTRSQCLAEIWRATCRGTNLRTHTAVLWRLSHSAMIVLQGLPPPCCLFLYLRFSTYSIATKCTFACPCFPVLDVDISTILHGLPLMTTCPFFLNDEHCIGYVADAPAEVASNWWSCCSSLTSAIFFCGVSWMYVVYVCWWKEERDL